ncbi:MAG: Spy/CpxP family protein refolding chaperone [Acidobacteriota bacterium]
MKSNKIKIALVAIILAIVVAIPLAMAQSGGKMGRREFAGQFRGHRGGGEGFMFKQLDLTDAQKEQIKQIRESHRATIKSLREQVHTAMREVHQANQGSAFDEAAVSQKLAQIAPLQAKLMAEEYKIRQETLAVLTAEQKAKMEQLREQFKSRRAERGAKKSPGTE